MASPRYEAPCGRPGCDGKVELGKSSGEVTLLLYRTSNGPAEVQDRDFICGGCTNDLADWWLHGKK